MEQQRTTKKPKLQKMDFGIFLVVLLLCAFGLVMVFSASYYSAQQNFDNGFYYVSKQALFMVAGLVIMLIVSRINYHWLEKWKTIILLASVVLLILVLIMGRETNGASRWLVIAGISIQPSEIAKFAMVFYMSSFMAHRQAYMSSFKQGILPMLIVIVFICGLVMLQPNMSMAVIMGMTGVGMLFVGGSNWKHMTLIMLVAIALFALLAVAAPYRFARLTSFTDPWKDPLGSGYQLIQSYYALGSGGLFGAGLNNSRQKLLYLTYGESDFIFSIIGEELGFIGALLVMLAYLFIIYRGIRIAMRCNTKFGSLLAAGITIVFAVQVMVNIGVGIGLFPTTGQALPFISAGGTSLMLFLAAMGVLLSISRDTSRA